MKKTLFAFACIIGLFAQSAQAFTLYPADLEYTKAWDGTTIPQTWYTPNRNLLFNGAICYWPVSCYNPSISGWVGIMGWMTDKYYTESAIGKTCVTSNYQIDYNLIISWQLFDLTRYCVGNGYWDYVSWGGASQNQYMAYHTSKTTSSQPGPGTYGFKSMSFSRSKITSSAQLTEAIQRSNISIQGASSNSGKEVLSTGSFQTPFLYLTNPPADTEIRLSSALNNFIAEPSFNLENGWKIAGGADEKLFYEAETAVANLNRHGRNFGSASELSEFLNNSDFLAKLGFDEIQKQNSLNYILPKMPEANNYYLTILSPEAISRFSNLEINPAPENLTRTFYAIYPSQVAVTTTGDFAFPEPQITSTGFGVEELGEFLVDENMTVLWEE